MWLLGATTYPTDNVVEEVLEFETPADAWEFHLWASRHVCVGAREVFPVGDLPGAVGARFHFSIDDRTADHVSFVMGARRYVLLLGRLRGSPDREHLFALVRDAVASASLPHSCVKIQHLVKGLGAWAKSDDPARIERLERLIPRGGPPGFRLESESRETRSKFTRWWTDGVAMLSEMVTQFPNTNSALEWLRDTIDHWCPLAASMSQEDQIPGSVLFFVQEPEILHQLVYFARGSRGYAISLFWTDLRDTGRDSTKLRETCGDRCAAEFRVAGSYSGAEIIVERRGG